MFCPVLAPAHAPTRNFRLGGGSAASFACGLPRVCFACVALRLQGPRPGGDGGTRRGGRNRMARVQNGQSHDVLPRVSRSERKEQHHYHKLNPETGERVPLRGCQRADKPGECKSDFPRTAWVSEESVILCPCELEKRGLAQHGRKNRLCSLHGPYGHEYLNGCHPAMLAGIRGGNVDVQVPYRLPYACRTSQIFRESRFWKLNFWKLHLGAGSPVLELRQNHHLAAQFLGFPAAQF